MNLRNTDLSPSEQRTGRVYNRRQLIGRLAAAGFSAPVIASILSNTPAAAWQATPMPEGTPSPETILASIGKDPRLISYS
ncbi:MAG: hypothetical protein M3411_02930, partial [Chloroflexota bacterium]|nr:hypothetical protein [Chloroflexota bacterium]